MVRLTPLQIERTAHGLWITVRVNRHELQVNLSWFDGNWNLSMSWLER